jgi:hypothetical protein
MGEWFNECPIIIDSRLWILSACVDSTTDYWWVGNCYWIPHCTNHWSPMWRVILELSSSSFPYSIAHSFPRSRWHWVIWLISIYLVYYSSSFYYSSTFTSSDWRYSPIEYYYSFPHSVDSYYFSPPLIFSRSSFNPSPWPIDYPSILSPVDYWWIYYFFASISPRMWIIGCGLIVEFCLRHSFSCWYSILRFFPFSIKVSFSCSYYWSSFINKSKIKKVIINQRPSLCQ